MEQRCNNSVISLKKRTSIAFMFDTGFCCLTWQLERVLATRSKSDGEKTDQIRTLLDESVKERTTIAKENQMSSRQEVCNTHMYVLLMLFRLLSGSEKTPNSRN